MLSILLPVLLLAAAAPSPAPAASAEPTKLEKIGSTVSRPLCARIVEHANVVIGSALDNDRTLAIVTANLRATDFDKLNFFQQRAAVNAADKQAGEVRFTAAAGQKIVKEMREEATLSNDPQRKEDLKAFADALGGALDRQRKAAAAVQAAVTILQGRQEAADVNETMHENNRTLAPPYSYALHNTDSSGSLLPPPPKSLDDFWRRIAADIDDRVTDIRHDEGIAADHSVGAVSGC